MPPGHSHDFSNTHYFDDYGFELFTRERKRGESEDQLLLYDGRRAANMTISLPASTVPTNTQPSVLNYDYLILAHAHTIGRCDDATLYRGILDIFILCHALSFLSAAATAADTHFGRRI